MSVETQRAQLKIILAAVSGIGTVSDVALVLQEEADLVDAFGSPILGCQFDRETTDEAPLVSLQHEASHTWLVQVVMDIDEAADSPKTFQTLIEAIRTALRAKPTLNATAEGTSGPPQARTVGHRDFGGYLVHYAEIAFTAIEVVDYTIA
jgi:hypothetical protein